jgi:hypothetical protein
VRSRAEQLDRERLAFHEAGHAVCCAAVGGRVVDAMIDDPGGCVMMIPPDDLVGHIAMFLAGDIGAALGVGGVLVNQEKPDYQRVRQLVGHLSRGDQAAVIAEAERRATAALWSNWAAVVRVADSLLRVGFLSGPDVARLLG